MLSIAPSQGIPASVNLSAPGIASADPQNPNSKMVRPSLNP